MRVLMSIKPEFVSKMITGEKTYEFRKILFKRSDIQTIVVYASHPVSKIVGEFYIDDVLTDQPENIWNTTRKHSGISKKFFDSYFAGKKVAHAISIHSFHEYSEPKTLDSVRISRAPQSFCYIE